MAKVPKALILHYYPGLLTAQTVTRTAARTTNLTVILLGAGLSVVLIYALTSELFSKNSPTVLYGDACERIKASPAVRFFISPFSLPETLSIVAS